MRHHETGLGQVLQGDAAETAASAAAKTRSVDTTQHGAGVLWVVLEVAHEKCHQNALSAGVHAAQGAGCGEVLTAQGTEDQVLNFGLELVREKERRLIMLLGNCHLEVKRGLTMKSSRCSTLVLVTVSSSTKMRTISETH